RLRPTPPSTLFPYTTLFRSHGDARARDVRRRARARRRRRSARRDPHAPGPLRVTGGPGGATPRRRLRRRAVPVAILALAVLLVATVLWLRPAEDRPAGDTAEPVDLADLPHPSEVARPDLSSAETRDPADPLAEGPVDAPVVLVVFTDYQCPYCARWTEDTLPALREHVDRGELRIEWRDV